MTEMQYIMVPDLRPVLLSILIIVLIVVALYALYAIFNLVKTLKKTHQMLDDFEIVAKIASERTQQLDKIIADMQTKLKTGQNIFNAVPIIVTAVSKIAKVVEQQNNKKSANAK